MAPSRAECPVWQAMQQALVFNPPTHSRGRSLRSRTFPYHQVVDFALAEAAQSCCVRAQACSHRNGKQEGLGSIGASYRKVLLICGFAVGYSSRLWILISPVSVRWTGHLLAISSSLRRCSSVRAPLSSMLLSIRSTLPSLVSQSRQSSA